MSRSPSRSRSPSPAQRRSPVKRRDGTPEESVSLKQLSYPGLTLPSIQADIDRHAHFSSAYSSQKAGIPPCKSLTKETFPFTTSFSCTAGTSLLPHFDARLTGQETLYTDISHTATASDLSRPVPIAPSTILLPTHLRRCFPTRTVPVQGSRKFQRSRAHVDYLCRSRQQQDVRDGYGAGRCARDEAGAQGGRKDIGRIWIHHWRPAQRVTSRTRTESAPAWSIKGWCGGRERKVRAGYRTWRVFGRLGRRQTEGEERELV